MGQIADQRSVTWMTSQRTQGNGAQVVVRTEHTEVPAPKKTVTRKPRRKASDG